ncbi:SH3 domain-containing protein [Frigidibacter sp. MR17.24]|uniref:SH3 domain-containing protein n=1 Tax=Frigidibacter sp. MR17.24 TaxID=3127345 RepID=UPI0030130F05
MFLIRLMKLVTVTVLAMLVVAQIWGRPPEGGAGGGAEKIADATPGRMPDATGADKRAALLDLIAGAAPATRAEAAEAAPRVIPAAQVQSAQAQASTAGADAAPAWRITRPERGLPVIHRAADDTAAAGTAPGAATDAGAAAGPVGYVTARRVNFREGPSTGDAVVDTLSRGEAVTLVGAPVDGWQRIRLEGSGGEGWMAARFLSETAPN